ncbi:two-partner secretion domain-containing protein [Acinetobacter baumannii]
MNKNLYRIVFNKARNMFMAVAENVRSQSKATGQSTVSGTVGSEQSLVQEKSFHQLWHVKALVVSISLLVPFAPVYAAIVADSAANAANRAVIAAGKNSAGTTVPVVNIQTPKNGISHNIYKQFDVLAEGAVLNNSRTGATTKTVGAVGANPFLATGEARVILNEVNSTAASRFEGNLEVAGQMADVIIANPSGINIKGGGFINANKAIFTTGKPQLNADGSIKQFNVNQGKVTITAPTNSTFGLGGNNNNANYIDIYARALDLNAKLQAKNDIQVITGANTVSSDLKNIAPTSGTGAAPTLAVDVKALGGMYANNIYLMGTEKGLGVTNAGTIQAVNNLVITSAGKIEHSGTITSTSKTQGLVNIQTTGIGAVADINSSGSINSNSMLNIDSGNNLNVNAKEIIINNGSLASSPLIINSKGNLNLAANSRIFNDAQSGDVYIDAANVNLATNAGITSNRGSAYIQSQKDVVAAQGAKLIAAQDLNVSGKGKLSLTGNQIQASLGSINLQADSSTTDGLIDIQGGTIYGGKDLNLYSSGDVNLQNLGFALENSATRVKNINAHSGRNLVWNNATKVLPQITGKVALNAENNLSISAQGISSKDSIQLQADQLTLNTNLTSQKDIGLIAETTDLFLNNVLNAKNDINISALAGGITANSLKANSNAGKISILANKNLALNSLQERESAPWADQDGATTDITFINGNKGVTLGSIGDGSVKLQSTHIIAEQGDIQLLAGNGVSLQANTDVTISGDHGYDNIRKNILQGQSLQIQNKKADIVIDNTNLTSSVGDLSINSEGKTILSNSKLNSKGNVELSAKDHLTLQNIEANADKHMAVSSKKNIYFNSKYGSTATPVVWDSSSSVNLKANGILSMMGMDHIANRTTYTGGAISLEANNLISPSAGTLTFNAMDSSVLTNDPALKNLEGDLTIQTNGALTLDPKVHKLGAAGDYELISKNGKLTLLGYGGTNGNFSETVFRLTNNMGGSHLEGNKGVEIQGTVIRNMKELKIIAPDGDIKIEGVKNTFNNSTYSKHSDYLSKQRLYYENKIQEINRLGVLNAVQKKLVAQYTEEINDITKQINFLSLGTNGAEHAGSLLRSETGKVNIVSGKGIMITGADILAVDGQVNIEAQGIGEKIYTSTALDKNSQPMSMNAGVILAAHNDFYDRGNETDQNYQAISLLTPTLVEGKRGVNIKTTGAQEGSNLILQAVGISSSEGDVKIESNKNILFDVALEQSYDRSTSIEKKKSWGGLKKKTITTFSENESTRPASVDISGKNIYIESKELNKNHKIDIYSGQFIAQGGDVFIRSGGDLYFNTVNEISKNQLEVNKKSSILGIKYNTSKTNSSYQVVTQVPSTLTASYIGTKSGFDTHLAGTEFNYLKEATIESGGKIFLEPSVTSINNTIKKEKNSVVWQSMQDKGAITETAKLPSFNGPTPPTFKAAGGLSVQIPISEKDANKKVLRDEILKLANQSGNTYLKDLVNRNDVDWQKVLLTQKDWDYKSQGLTGAGAALIVIIVTIATMGTGTAAAAGAAGGTAASGTTVGLGASMLGTAGVTTTAAGAIVPSTLGVMANAAVTSLAAQASVSLINNGGDIGKTLKEMGSKDSIKNLAASVVTAGLLSQVGTALNLKPDSTLLSDRLVNNFTTSVGSTLVQTAINGGDLGDNLQVALLAGLAGALQGELASQIGTNLDKVDPNIFEYTIHKIAHAVVGCAAAAATKQSCEAGAIGAGVGEIIAELMIPEGKTALDLTDAEKTKIKDTSKILAGVTAAYAGYDVNTAANSANIAVENNTFGRLLTTAGKAAYKVAKVISEMPASVRANLKPADVIEMLRKEGVQGVIDIGDNLVTLVSPSSTLGDRTFAIIDLAIGVDLKAAKNVDALKADREIITQNVSILEKRPTHRASEIDVGKQLGNTALPQVSYKGGQIVPYGTPGSVRPDFSIGNTVGVEVKNYNIANNSSGLISNVSKQVITRAEHLPKGMQQQVVIDIRGQNVTEQQRMAIRSGIISKSNGLISVGSIRFKEN